MGLLGESKPGTPRAAPGCSGAHAPRPRCCCGVGALTGSFTATHTVSSMPVFEVVSLAPLGGWGHHGALAWQMGAELPEVRGSTAAKSHAKPGFPLPQGRRAFSSSSAQPAPCPMLLRPG